MTNESPLLQPLALLEELNCQIWIPFSDAYASGNPEPYLALHSPKLIRGEGNQKRVMNLVQYADAIRQAFQHWKAEGARPAVQFRFVERIVSEEAASERGIFQFHLTSATGEQRTFYGKFHVIARKEQGRWKILLDYDSSEGGTITEATYAAAHAMEEVERFV
jgi:hypothetical protein